MTAPKTLTKKEESHIFWTKENGGTDENIILMLLSAGRSRGWTPRYTAETISRFFIWKEVENKSQTLSIGIDVLRKPWYI
jgi:hypothetical protein